MSEYSAAIPRAAEAVPTIEGFLLGKKKTFKHKELEQSYAVLEGTKLSLFASKALGQAPLAVLEVTGTTGWHGKGEKRAAEHPFAITTAKHIYFETAPTAEEKESWLQTIEDACNYQKAAEDMLRTDKAAIEVSKLVRSADVPGDAILASGSMLSAGLIQAAKSGAIAQKAMMRHGVVPILVRLLSSGDTEVCKQSAYLLRSMAGWSAETRHQIVESAAIPSIIALVGSNDDVLCQQAVAVIANLARGNQKDIADAGGIEALVPRLNADNEVTQRYSVTALRNLASLSENLPKIEAAGALRYLVPMLSIKEVRTVEQVVALIRNLTVSPSNQVLIGQRLLGLGPLIVLCSCPADAVQKQAAGALANLACNAENRQMIGSLGGIEPLVQLVALGKPLAIQFPAILALKNLTHSDAKNCLAVCESSGVRNLVQVIQQQLQLGGNVEQRAIGMQSEGAAVLANVAMLPQNHRILVETGVTELMVSVLKSNSGKLARLMKGMGAPSDEKEKLLLKRKLAQVMSEQTVQQHAAAILEQLADNTQVQAKIRQLGGLAPLVQLMAFSPLREVQEKAAAALGQLAQDPENAGAIVSHHGLVYLLKKTESTSPTVQAEAAGALAILAGFPEICNAVADDGKLGGLLSMVESEDAPCQEAALAALANICLGSDAMKTDIAHTASLRVYVLAMQKFEAQSRLAENSAALLGNLANGSQHNQLKIGNEPNALTSLLKTLQPNAAGASASVALLRNSAAALRNLTEHEVNQLKLSKLGGMEVLLQLLLKHSGTEHSNEQIAIQAVATLRNLTAVDDSNKVALREFGGFDLLSQLLSTKNVSLQEKTIGTLGNALTLSRNRADLAQQPDKISAICATLDAQDERVVETAVSCVANLCLDASCRKLVRNLKKSSSGSPHVHGGGGRDVVQQLVLFASDPDDPVLQTSAAKAIENLLLDEDTQLSICDVVMAPLLLMLQARDTQSYSNSACRAQAARALVALAKDAPENQTKVGSSRRIVSGLVALLTSVHREEKVNASNALRELAMDVDNRSLVAEAGALPPLVTLSNSHDTVQCYTALDVVLRY